MSKKVLKMFVVRKYVMADSVSSALKQEKKLDAYEIFVDDEWRKNNSDKLADAIGFTRLSSADEQ